MQGVFVFTPHSAGTQYSAVVRRGNTAVNGGSRVQVNFLRDPVNEPVEAHWQFDTFTQNGFPCKVYVVWIDGAADENSGRPDFPIMGNAKRVGVPHVFCVTKPHSGVLPPQPYTCVVVLAGGEGLYHLLRPGEPDRTNMTLDLSKGIVLTPDDYECRRAARTPVAGGWRHRLATV